jgi:hypothetical protein
MAIAQLAIAEGHFRRRQNHIDGRPVSRQLHSIRNATPPWDQRSWRGGLGRMTPGTRLCRALRPLLQMSAGRWVLRRIERWTSSASLRTGLIRTKVLTGNSPTFGNAILFAICSSAAHADKLLWTRLSCFDKILEAFERVHLMAFSDAAKSWTKCISTNRDHRPCCDRQAVRQSEV